MKVSRLGGAGVLVLALILAVVPLALTPSGQNLGRNLEKVECGSALAPKQFKEVYTPPMPTPGAKDSTVGIKLQGRKSYDEISCDEAVKNRRILSGVIAGLGVLILGGTLLKSESSSSSRPVSPPLKPEPKVEEPKEPESQPTDTKSFCSQCGEKLTIGAKFCSACGVVV